MKKPRESEAVKIAVQSQVGPPCRPLVQQLGCRPASALLTMLARGACGRSVRKQRQNLFVEEFQPARQNLGVGGIRVDIDWYQFRYGFSVARGLNPDFKGTNIPIQRFKWGLSIVGWQIRRRHITDDHPCPWVHICSVGLYLEKENVNYPFGAVTKIFAFDG
ncbi:hypothetical protein [Mesorhizobium sp.]|uniref:hypothetical protein n=1 Tax=Mesorhizobium sp. TaxID=1871066 RepID=UPI000FE976A2|nr:hypothetical protein [Mesorhizobium sp.]RWQ14531.1 MAG: hypothetical protein EOR93_29270 [Mesorhizobium sp.]